ncbi:hypothetical protein M9Y10_026995 [Tritrichomonas musculus]|uniref:Uncharacterized protein n=1 Tax=Tritrichomonas musculus TaxID=1915356 RepID=A0ABR2H5F0_9EUKA
MAIKHDCIKAMLKYGRILFDDELKEESIEYIKKAADKGNSKALYLYYTLLEKGEVKNEACVTMDKKEAIKYFKHGIEKEDSTAMVNYEYMIENGEDTEMNKEKSD